MHDKNDDGETDVAVWFPKATRRRAPFSLVHPGDRLLVQCRPLGVDGERLVETYDGIIFTVLEDGGASLTADVETPTG